MKRFPHRVVPPAQQGGGVTRPQPKPLRCQAKHDVPWSERCVLNPKHAGDHLDKAGRSWVAK